jgi:hypothetical protein
MKYIQIITFLTLLSLSAHNFATVGDFEQKNPTWFEKFKRGCIGLLTGTASGTTLGIAAVYLNDYINQQLSQRSIKEKLLYRLVLESMLVTGLVSATHLIAQQSNIPHNGWISGTCAHIVYRGYDLIK